MFDFKLEIVAIRVGEMIYLQQQPKGSKEVNTGILWIDNGIGDAAQWPNVRTDKKTGMMS